ncbi:hypothetical protein GPECTOR_47g336 [Gonium pectorale]|uniref:Uncharacterized protein n=1 Tax=Gonium pectorale TaxID=33097 RepID=A0A150G8C4_GONPE|nr:hypothetical protein GPECTOR_47g336 [Gonium pectorale]|eukprot:KXZ46061.1 hypothetical protein GPECTOR_47g336 [Gonium pectorale]
MPSLDELHLVTAIGSEGYRQAAQLRQREIVEPELQDCVVHHVVLKEDDYTLYESLGRYVSSVVRPHIIFMGSTNLCTPVASAARPVSRAGPASWSYTWGIPASRPGTSSGRPATAGGNSLASRPTVQPFEPPSMGLLGASSTALKVLPEMRCAPVLLAKHNSRGSWLNHSGGSATAPTPGSPSGVAPAAAAATPPPLSRAMSRNASLLRPASAAQASAALEAAGANSAPPMRVMVDLQANSRHVLDWLFEHFTPGRDHLLLTVSQAYDEQHNVKPSAQRLLTAFGVQAAVNAFEAEKAVLAGPANKSLPLAVADSEPDVLVVQAPRCKGLPAPLVELLYCARTSFLIWPPDYDARQRARA